MHKSTKYSRKKETELQEFLKFLGTLSATHSAIRYKLSDDQWCSSLLRIVDIDTKTGTGGVVVVVLNLLSKRAKRVKSDVVCAHFLEQRFSVVTGELVYEAELGCEIEFPISTSIFTRARK